MAIPSPSAVPPCLSLSRIISRTSPGFSIYPVVLRARISSQIASPFDFALRGTFTQSGLRTLATLNFSFSSLSLIISSSPINSPPPVLHDLHFISVLSEARTPIISKIISAGRIILKTASPSFPRTVATK